MVVWINLPMAGWMIIKPRTKWVRAICGMISVREKPGLPGARRHPGHRRIPSRIYCVASVSGNGGPFFYFPFPFSLGHRFRQQASGDYGQPDRAPAVVVRGSLSARRRLNGWLVGLAYLAENSSYVSSSW